LSAAENLRKEIEKLEKEVSKKERKFYEKRNVFNKYPKSGDPGEFVKVADEVIDDYARLADAYRKYLSSLDESKKDP
jgi:hypothetical protein